MFAILLRFRLKETILEKFLIRFDVKRKKKIEDASSNDEKFYKFAEYSCLNIEHSRVTNVDENRNKTMEVSEYESWNNNKLRAFTLKFPVAS